MKSNGNTHGQPDELLSVGDVAHLYGVSDETVRRWCRKGIIAYVMVGPFRLKRIARVDVEHRVSISATHSS